MATQEEWRKIAHEREMGRRTGNSSGSIWGAQGAAQFHQEQKQRADRDRQLKDANDRLFKGNQNGFQTAPARQQERGERKAVPWETANTVISLLAFAGWFIYLRFNDSMDIGSSVGLGLLGGLIVGRFYKVVLLLGSLYGALEVYLWYLRAHP